MRVDPAITALRGDVASQRRSQAALEAVKAAWRADAGAGVVEGLQRYAQGAKLGDCAMLAAEFLGSDLGRIRELLSGWLDCLSRHPFGHVPARHQYSGGIGLIQLAESGGAALSLVLHEASSAQKEPRTVSFVDAERHEFVLAGKGCASGYRWSGRDGDQPESRQLSLEPGSLVALPDRYQAKQVVRVDQSLVMLRLSRAPERPRPSVELCLADGRIVHRATGDRRESCREMAMAVLTAMGRTDAVPALAARALLGGCEERWQTLRHCLALDGSEGMRLLRMVASDTTDPLNASAAQLLAVLAQRFPEFAQDRPVACHA
ncbi:hypothetical protein [Parerythrobacter lacustris]|uniref:Uncharacterized protein n=1 Tax=Parerythrobacter lacustris TaxID=2969984 RepID=A0ABT1XWN0_9SPHN|nr:hypothetical protein [Parerythrobacter lacustris]MCR2835095.1 hypothetical protein [Parerythrobacter lacustris]